MTPPAGSERERPRIAIVVNAPVRDLPGSVLLARELVRRGADVFLVPSKLLQREQFVLAPDFVLLNHLRRTNEKRGRELRAAKIQIGVLDSEGGVMPNLETFEKKMTRDRALLREVACFCSWGPRVAEFALERDWFSPGVVSVTGHPRFDFYVEPWLDAARSVSGYTRMFSSPLVLLNTRFSLVNPDGRTAEQQKRSFVRLGWTEEKVDEWQRIQRRALDDFIEMANRLARELPAVTFIFRPHPFENFSFYHGKLEALPNLHLNREGAIDGWLSRVCVVVQRSCSTAFEGGLANVLSLSPKWIEIPEEIESMEVVSVQCENHDALRECIREAAAGAAERPSKVVAALEQVVRDWFFAVDGESHLRVADEIMKAHVGRRDGVDRKACRAGAFRWSGDKNGGALHRLTRWLRAVAGRPPEAVTASYADWEASDKRFDAPEVRELIDALERCAPEAVGEVRVCAASAAGHRLGSIFIGRENGCERGLF